MPFRYTPTQRLTKKLYRKFFPVPRSPWTMGEVEDICAVNLVPPETLKTFFADRIDQLQKVKGDDIGDYLEFGVFNGASLSSIYLTAKEKNVDSMRFLGFDAFEGLPAGAESEDDGVWKKAFTLAHLKI